MITFSQLGHQGRMSNQIFQMACTIATALRNNDQYIFPTWQYEQFFNLYGCFSNNIKPTKTYVEPHFHYAPIPYTDTKNEVLDLVGYFQTHRYWEGYDDLIRQLFTPNYNIGRQENMTSIHIRRGDYLQFADCHTNLNMNYYRQAMQLCPSERYLIFSDDISWCRGQFIGSQFEFAEENHETLDLFLMSKCANNILANSSFSWFGAWLNTNSNKKVICPKNWFGWKLKHDTKDLIQKEWIQI